MPMASQLAPELLLSIFKEANTKTLHTLLFVSVTFNTIAEPILYENVVLRLSNKQLPCPITSFLGSLHGDGLYRRQYVKHLSIFADDHWSYHRHLAFILRDLPNLLSFRLEDKNNLFRFDITGVEPRRFSRARPFAALRVGQANDCPPLDFAWSRPLLDTVCVLSSPYTEYAITQYASILPNITCWELRGDLRSLDDIGRQEMVAALRSTRVQCIRFVRQSWACSADLISTLFVALPRLQCIELYARDAFSDTCWRFYRGGGPAFRVWWLCDPGEEWKMDWQIDILKPTN